MKTTIYSNGKTFDIEFEESDVKMVYSLISLYADEMHGSDDPERFILSMISREKSAVIHEKWLEGTGGTGLNPHALKHKDFCNSMKQYFIELQVKTDHGEIPHKYGNGLFVWETVSGRVHVQWFFAFDKSQTTGAFWI